MSRQFSDLPPKGASFKGSLGQLRCNGSVNVVASLCPSFPSICSIRLSHPLQLATHMFKPMHVKRHGIGKGEHEEDVRTLHVWTTQVLGTERLLNIIHASEGN